METGISNNIDPIDVLQVHCSTLGDLVEALPAGSVADSGELQQLHMLIEARVALASRGLSGYGHTHVIEQLVARPSVEQIDFDALSEALDTFAAAVTTLRPTTIDAIFTERIKAQSREDFNNLTTTDFGRSTQIFREILHDLEAPSISLPGNENPRKQYQRLEALFEQTGQALEYLCLSMPQLGLFTYGKESEFASADQLVEARKEWLQRYTRTAGLVASLLREARLGETLASELYWERPETATWTRIHENRLELDASNQRHQIYLDHAGFRNFKRLEALNVFQAEACSLLDLTHSYALQKEPQDAKLRAVYGFGESISLSDPANGPIVEICLERIAEDTSKSLLEARKEVLRFRDAYLGRPFPVRPSRSTPLVNLSHGKWHDHIELGLYRKLDTALIDSCVRVAETCTVADPYNPDLIRGGITQPLTAEKLIALSHKGKARIATIEVDGNIEGFQLVILGKDVFPEAFFQRFFEQHPFPSNGKAFLKFAGLTPKALAELVENGVKTRPFDMMHRRMMAELRFDEVKQLYCLIRQEPVPNKTSIRAAVRNLGTSTGFVEQDPDAPVPIFNEIYMLPVQFQGFYSSGLNYE